MLSKFIGKIRKKKIPRSLYLGDVFVNPRSEVKAVLEWNMNGENSSDELSRWIAVSLNLPEAKGTKPLPERALVLDVAVLKYQVGTDMALYSEPLIPIMWRPSVKMKVRLRDGSTLKTLGEHHTKSIMSWGEYFSRVISLKAIFSFRGTFSAEDLQKLLAESLVKCLVWTKKYENS
jgi:hypothetical protein